MDALPLRELPGVSIGKAVFFVKYKSYYFKSY